MVDKSQVLKKRCENVTGGHYLLQLNNLRNFEYVSGLFVCNRSLPLCIISNFQIFFNSLILHFKEIVAKISIYQNSSHFLNCYFYRFVGVCRVICGIFCFFNYTNCFANKIEFVFRKLKGKLCTFQGQ